MYATPKANTTQNTTMKIGLLTLPLKVSGKNWFSRYPARMAVTPTMHPG